MNRIVSWFSHGLIRYRFGFLGLCVLISLFFGWQVAGLSFKTNIGDFYPLKHPFLKIQNRLTEVFGGLNQVSIAIEVRRGNILNDKTLQKVWQITNQLYLTDGINPGRVVSLSARKVKHVEANEDGFATEWLMHDPAHTPDEIERLRQRIIINPLVYGPMVSKDFRATLIQADFESDVSSRDIFKLLQEIKRRFEDENHRIYISGQPLLQGWLDFYLPRMSSLFFVTLGVMALILYYAFKSKRGVFLPLTSAFMATLWGLGLTAFFGYKLTPSTVLAPFLVFALGEVIRSSSSSATMNTWVRASAIPRRSPSGLRVTCLFRRLLDCSQTASAPLRSLPCPWAWCRALPLPSALASSASSLAPSSLCPIAYLL